MKKILFSLSVMIFGSIAMNAQSVSVNTDGSTADASSILDIKSTTKGMLVPRMTTAQRTTIPTPANGLLVYDTDVKSFWYYNGTAWTNITSAGSSMGNFSLPIDSVGSFTGPAIGIYNQNGSFNDALISSGTLKGYAFYGSSDSSNAIGGVSKSASGAGIFGSNYKGGVGVKGVSYNNYGISGWSQAEYGVYGTSHTDGKGGVFGESTADGIGVKGNSNSGTGVLGQANYSGTGVEGWNGASGIGVKARGNNGIALLATSSGPFATAGKFVQNSIQGKALEVEGNLSIKGGNTTPGAGKILTSDANGNATWKNPITQKVGFGCRGVKGGGSNVIANDYNWHKVYFDVENYDPGNNYTTYFETPASTFTVPISGFYNLDAFVTWVHKGGQYDIADIRMVVERSGTIIPFAHSQHTYNFYNNGDEIDNQISSRVGLNIRLLAGDKIWVEARYHYSGSINTGLETDTKSASFSGFLIFAD